MRFYIEKLGCPKNDTDAEGISQLLVEAGYTPAVDADEADVIIVNTCGFIDRAKDESLKCLRRYAKRKRHWRSRGPALWRRVREVSENRWPGGTTVLSGTAASSSTDTPRPILIAAGCLSERYGEDLSRSLPEIDGFVGTQRWEEIPAVLNDILHGRRPCYLGKGYAIASVPRTARSPSAYVKIADGCSVGCAFCAIPRIKGPHRSKPPSAVVAEVRHLASAGVKEIILIAQNTAAYGHDWGEKDGLAILLEKIVESVPQIPWIRIMYAYPEHITDRLVKTIAGHHQIVKYLDVPLQHAHPDVLRQMKRPVDNARPLIARLRESIPGVSLRSAFIVGYPGEDEEKFQSLLSFLRDVELDRVGIFTYSAEEGTLAASLPNQVSPRIKLDRERRAMTALREISARKSQALLGSILDVLVEGTAEHGEVVDDHNHASPAPGRRQVGSKGVKARPDTLTFLSVGRSYRDAPEVDGLVFLKERVPVGSLVRARVIGASEYDLFAEIAKGDC